LWIGEVGTRLISSTVYDEPVTSRRRLVQLAFDGRNCDEQRNYVKQ